MISHIFNKIFFPNETKLLYKILLFQQDTFKNSTTLSFMFIMISLFQKNLHLTLSSGSFFSSKIFLFQPDIYLFQQDIFMVYKPSSATRGTQSPPEGNFPGTKNQEQGRLEVPHSDYSWVSFFVPTPAKILDQLRLKSKAEQSMAREDTAQKQCKLVIGDTAHTF